MKPPGNNPDRARAGSDADGARMKMHVYLFACLKKKKRRRKKSGTPHQGAKSFHLWIFLKKEKKNSQLSAFFFFFFEDHTQRRWLTAKIARTAAPSAFGWIPATLSVFLRTSLGEGARREDYSD